MKVAKQIKTVLDGLVDMAEEEGSARVTLSVAQAETYARLYLGIKLEAAIASLELLEETDPLFGWGIYAKHDVTVKPKRLPIQYPLDTPEDTLKALHLDEKRNTDAWLEVRVRKSIVATMKMFLVRATVSPVIVPDMEVKGIMTRRKKLLARVLDPGLQEKINHLTFRQQGPDVWIGIIDRPIEKIPADTQS